MAAKEEAPSGKELPHAGGLDLNDISEEEQAALAELRLVCRDDEEDWLQPVRDPCLAHYPQQRTAHTCVYIHDNMPARMRADKPASTNTHTLLFDERYAVIHMLLGK